jgi:hypothetical protein
MKKQTEDPIYLNDLEMKYLRGNPYVAFLLRQIDQELERMSNTEAISTQNANTTFDQYEFSKLSTDDKIDFFWFNMPDNRQFAEYVMRIFTGSPNNDSEETFGDPDQSWMLKRIASLKKKFAENLIKISEEYGLPFNSVAKMYHLLVYCMAYTEIEDDILSQYPDAPDDFWQILVPAGLSDTEREDIVVNAWGRIRKLFIECIHVFVFTGALETLYLTALYQKDGLEPTKDRILSTAFDEGLADVIGAIHSENDLQEFFRNNLFCFIDGLINIAKSFKSYLDLTALKKLRINMKNSKINIRDKAFFKYSSIKDFSHRLNKSNGMLQKYNLKGNPHNLVKYTQSTFNNLSRNYNKNHFEELAKEKFGISKRQLDRYNKNLKKGNYDHLLTGEDRRPESIYDISDNEFMAIREIENLKLQHRKDGYLSQNQLISTLTASSMDGFELKEFIPPHSPQQVIEIILKAGYAVPLEFSEYNDDDTSRAVDLLNFILEMPDFIDGVIIVKPDFLFSNDVNKRIIETEPFRKLDFDKLPANAKRSIKTLNRLVLEQIHPDVTPKGSRTNFFSKEYGIDFVDISRSTYITILRKLICDGKLQVIKEGQTNYYPVDRQYISNVARLISEHQKNKRNKKSVS